MDPTLLCWSCWKLLRATCRASSNSRLEALCCVDLLKPERAMLLSSLLNSRVCGFAGLYPLCQVTCVLRLIQGAVVLSNGAVWEAHIEPLLRL